MDFFFRFQFVYTLVTLLLIAVSGAKYLNIKQLYDDFYAFALNHDKPYIKNGNFTELQHRFNIFKENVAQAHYLNNGLPKGSPSVYGINKFSDLSPEEFKAKYLTGFKPTTAIKLNELKTQDLVPLIKSQSLPSKVDWRDKGVINPVMDQGSCGACWAFSMVETIESMYGIQKNSSAPALSVQELIDCDKNNSGCEGGSIKFACDWSLQNGVVWSDQYPLTDKKETCHNLSPSLPRVHLKDCLSQSYEKNESLLLQTLAFHGPVAVAIDATTWHNYIGGIIQFHCNTNLNHAVQVVGYNLEGDVPYYIIRNSWGANFGDHGYVYVKYGKNVCGLAIDVTSTDVDFNRSTFH